MLKIVPCSMCCASRVFQMREPLHAAADREITSHTGCINDGSADEPHCKRSIHKLAECQSQAAQSFLGDTGTYLNPAQGLACASGAGAK